MKKSVSITAVLLVISIVNALNIMSNSLIRAVDALSLFAVGALSGVLITQIFMQSKNKDGKIDS